MCIYFPASSLHKTFCNQAVWILLRHGKSSGQNLPPSEVNASFSRFPSLFHSLPSTFLLLSLPLSISSNRAHGRLWSLRPSNPPTCNAICYIGMKWGKGFCDYYKKPKNPGSVAKEQQADVKQRDTSHSNTLLSSWEAASSACWRGATGKASFLMFNFGLWSSLSLQEKRPLRNA